MELLHCLGAIDGKHTVMQAPPSAGSMYFNHEQTHSIVLLAVCDAHYCFTLIDIGDCGWHSDSGVLSNSNFGQVMENHGVSIPSPDYSGRQGSSISIYATRNTGNGNSEVEVCNGSLQWKSL